MDKYRKMQAVPSGAPLSFASHDKARPLLSTLSPSLIGSLPLDDRRWFRRGTIEGSLKRRYREGNYFRPLLTTPFIPITSKPRLKFISAPIPLCLSLLPNIQIFKKNKLHRNEAKFFPRFRKLLSLLPPSLPPFFARFSWNVHNDTVDSRNTRRVPLLCNATGRSSLVDKFLRVRVSRLKFQSRSISRILFKDLLSFLLIHVYEKE